MTKIIQGERLMVPAPLTHSLYFPISINALFACMFVNASFAIKDVYS